MSKFFHYLKAQKSKSKWVQEQISDEIYPTGAHFITIHGFKEKHDHDAEKLDLDCLVKRYGPYILDIDADGKKKQTLADSLADVKKLCQKLVDMGLSENHFKIYFSGKKGFHVVIPPELFGAEDGHIYMALINKEMDSILFPEKDFPTLDRTIRNMGKGRMIRLPNLKRDDNGLHKIRISLGEINSVSENWLLNMAQMTRNDPKFPKNLPKNDKLSRIYQQCLKKVELAKSQVHEINIDDVVLHDIPPCLEKILQSEAPLSDDVNFNKICFSCIVPTFKKMGYSLEDMSADENVIQFLDNYQSNSYPSPIHRIEHLDKMWMADEVRPRKFSCGSMLVAINKDIIVCEECQLKADSLLSFLDDMYGAEYSMENYSGKDVEVDKANPNTEFDSNSDNIKHNKKDFWSKPSKNKTINDLNKKFTLTFLGSKEAIAWRGADSEIRFLSRNAFQTLMGNIKTDSLTSSGKPTKISVANYWLEHIDRDTRPAVVFKPTDEVNPYEYNLWQGFQMPTVIMRQEDAENGCKLYLQLLKDVICNGDDILYEYILNWLAHLIQKPEEKPGVCLVLRGKEGTGKGSFVHPILKIIGKGHSIKVTNRAHFFSRFNATYEKMLFINLDEAVWAGNTSEMNTLKSFITEPEITVERKGYQQQSIDSYSRVVMCSNDDWVVPAGKEARRYCVLDVSDKFMQDSGGFFKDLYAEFNKGGTESLFAFLMMRDLSEVNLKQVPFTKGLKDQKILSFNSVDRFWDEILEDEHFPNNENNFTKQEGEYIEMEYGSLNWPVAVDIESLYEKYLEWCNSRRISHFDIKPRKSFSNIIGRYMQCDNSKRAFVKGKKKLICPELEICQKFWDELIDKN